MKKEIVSIKAIKETIQLDKDKFYFISPFGLGDTVILCGLKKIFEEKNNGKIHFIIKHSHEIIMRMFNIDDYTLISEQGNWHYKNKYLLYLAKKNPYPHKGSLYVAHPDYHGHLKGLCFKLQKKEKDIKFLSWYKDFLDLDENCKFEKPVHYPSMSTTLKEKIKDIPLDKLILFIPEAKSVPSLPKAFWENLYMQKVKNGFKIISSIQDKKNLIPNIENIETEISDLIALSMSCKEVHILRNGLCEVLQEKGSGLCVYYSFGKKHQAIYSLNDIFNRHDIHEKVVRSHSGIIKRIKYLIRCIM